MEASLRDLLEIENDASFLEFSCPKTGYLLWPLIRQQFLRQLISNLYYKSAPLLTPVGPVPAGQAAMALPAAIMHNWRSGPMRRSDILVLGTGAGAFLREGRWFNRITDYFVQASPENTVSIEGVVDWHIPEPRWSDRVTYWLPWQVAIALKGRLSLQSEHTKSAYAVLNYARQRAQTLLGLRISDPQMQMLTDLVSRKIARLPLSLDIYRRMLEKIRPRLVINEEACYGDHGVFNHIAREMGVRVAEPQHGMVSGGHDAYCYASQLRENDSYQSYLPHDFLGYGRWWNEQINAPVNKWVIGHPHYSEQRIGLSQLAASEKNILILSDGIEFSKYLTLAIEVSSLLGGRYHVILRPHPLERARVYKRYPDGRAGLVTIDQHRDIYQSLANSYTVAGEVSTGLFEAIGIVRKILLWETPKARFSYPNHPFSSFVDAKTFAEAILSPDTTLKNVRQEDIWASNWRANYSDYLNHVLHEVPA